MDSADAGEHADHEPGHAGAGGHGASGRRHGFGVEYDHHAIP
ncbi:hypothetical protein AZ78_2050 [Lysobacter capsici AZ78]|uniref:Uncharacterized protein n=1 Tax=Lysobacter capsici AZ78 TaxID=1444315 RepID=A0A108U8H6_9GAMM|nr:hypothetical protein AZ78_2050 [Lysobacter capsici AZ78]